MTDNIQAKGEELIEKFRNEYSWVEKDFPVDLWRDAKQCAIIAVEEIIKVLRKKDTAFTYLEKEIIEQEQILNYLKSKL